MEDLSKINFLEIDNRMQKSDRLDKIRFAKKMGYRYYTEMLAKKHIDEDMKPRDLATWIKNESSGLQQISVTQAGITYKLKAMGILKPVRKKRGCLALKKNICTCCGINEIDKDLRFLCKSCYKGNHETEPHCGASQYIGK